jgi:hypothetical protein
MSGWYKMHRGWMDDDLFRGEPFCKRAAWEWLIHEAAFEDHHQWFNGERFFVKRGQVMLSERSLAEALKWDRQRVRTFLKQLERDQKVTRQLTQGVTQLTICNYEKFQQNAPTEQPTKQPRSNPELTQLQPTTEEGKEGKEGEEGKKETARGTRLPSDWVLPDEWREFAKAEKRWSDSDVSAEANQFRDYWVALSGSKAVKSDWLATWRNWVRRSNRKANAASNPMAGLSFQQARAKLVDLTYDKDMAHDRWLQDKSNQERYEKFKALKLQVEALNEALNGKSEWRH